MYRLQFTPSDLYKYDIFCCKKKLIHRLPQVYSHFKNLIKINKLWYLRTVSTMTLSKRSIFFYLAKNNLKSFERFFSFTTKHSTLDTTCYFLWLFQKWTDLWETLYNCITGTKLSNYIHWFTTYFCLHIIGNLAVFLVMLWISWELWSIHKFHGDFYSRLVIYLFVQLQVKKFE